MRFATLLIPLCLLGCRSNPETDEEPQFEYPYSGPLIETALVGGETQPILRCNVETPMPGQRLAFNRTLRDGETILVYATLHEPAPNATPAVDESGPVALDVPLQEPFDYVELHIARWIDDVQYVRQPEHQLAAQIASER